jgi:hypothetical protein
MSLFKRNIGRRRHIGRRVVGVGAGVALMVLGLQAPAFAAAPTVTGLAPTSGPEGCVVIVTGTAFTDFPDTDPDYDVEFVAGGSSPSAFAFAVISATEIWATAPDLTPGTTRSESRTMAGPGAALQPSWPRRTGPQGLVGQRSPRSRRRVDRRATLW